MKRTYYFNYLLYRHKIPSIIIKRNHITQSCWPIRQWDWTVNDKKEIHMLSPWPPRRQSSPPNSGCHKMTVNIAQLSKLTGNIAQLSLILDFLFQSPLNLNSGLSQLCLCFGLWGHLAHVPFYCVYGFIM